MFLIPKKTIGGMGVFRDRDGRFWNFSKKSPICEINSIDCSDPLGRFLVNQLTRFGGGGSGRVDNMKSECSNKIKAVLCCYWCLI